MSSTEDEIEVITELGDEALELVSASSRRIVFGIRGIPPCTALGTCNVMFRGDDDVIEKHGIVAYLCIVKGDSLFVASIAKQDPQVDDARVLVFPDWKNHAPLPVSPLAVVILTSEQLDPTCVKFGADVVPLNPAFKHHWRCTLKNTGSVFSFNGPVLQSIQGALDIANGSTSNLVCERSRIKETWQSVSLSARTHVLPNRIPWDV
jgi:hypothetical protein